MFERLFGYRRAGPRRRGAHPARPVQDREVPGPPLRLGAAHRPRDLGLQGLGRGRLAVHADLGPVQGAAAQDGPHGHPLRDALDQARHDWEGVADPDDPRDGRGPADRRPTSSRTPSRATPRTCRSSVLDDDDVLLADTFGGAAARARARLPAPARSSRSATSGRAASGSAASSSSTTTSSASGSATATTTTPIRGRKSASASSGA